MVGLLIPRGIYLRLTRRITFWLPRWQRVLTFFTTTTPLGIYLFKPQLLAWATIPFPVWLRWTGVGLGIASDLLFLWANIEMNHVLFNQSGQFQDMLVTSGPFRWVRHPVYSAFCAVSLGFLLISANLIVGIAWLATTSIALLPNIASEEQSLIEHYGTVYRQYHKTTGSLFPRYFAHRRGG